MFNLKFSLSAAALSVCCLFSSVLNAETLQETGVGNPRFEFNMKAHQKKNAVDNAVKTAISKRIGELRKEKFGGNSSVQIISLKADAASFVIMQNKKPAANVSVTVSDVRILSNDRGAFPRTEKTVKFNLKGVHRTYPGSGVYSEAAHQFLVRNSETFDCIGEHEHGSGTGTRQFCKDIVRTVRKIIEFEMNIKIVQTKNEE